MQSDELSLNFSAQLIFIIPISFLIILHPALFVGFNALRIINT